MLRGVLRVAVERRYIIANPCDAVKLPKRGTRRRISITPLTHAEVRALAEAIPGYRVLVYTAAYTGLRAGELGALRREDLDLLRGTLTVDETLKEINSSADSLNGDKGLVFGPTKTHATRTISVPRFLCDLLAEHLRGSSQDPRALVFTTASGKPIRHNLFYKRVFKPAVRSSLPAALHGFRFHDLRHTCAALLIGDGAHPLAIKTRLGHEDIRTTMNVYGHLFPSGEEALAEALDAGYRSVEVEPEPDNVVSLRSEG